ncbi:MAG TPA: TRAP transporter small permease [Alphaproteobacteria bacterium]|nr:TRAP transporter small permease [Alphaproteobacteria bacterium]
MKVFARLLERVALAVLLLGAIGLVISTVLGTADVIGTQFFGQPVHGALEITESTMVVIVFGALAYSQIRRNHIRVEIFYTRGGPRTQAAMDVFANLMALLFFSLLLWQAINEAMFSLQINESTFGLIRIPLWPARIMLAAGTALLLLQLLVDLVTDSRRLIEGGKAITTEDVLQREIGSVDSLIDPDGR